MESQTEASTTARTTSRIMLADTRDLGCVFEEDEAIAIGRRRFALLVFCDADARLQTLEEGAGVVVGRDAPSEVVVDDPSISRQHARFLLSGGEVTVQDLDSRNGTFVGGSRVEQRRLVPGEQVTIGKARVILAATCAPKEAGADPGDGYVIRSASMRALYDTVERAAASNVPVLVLGETGSGKEHVARSLHAGGPRRDGPFVVVNCASIPGSLLESTLFGHERGAFTGASARSAGAFERASGGVLFLDEVGELGLSSQASLLRAVETGRICRVGSTTEVPVDVRLVSATHCDLSAMTADGTFRNDLFFRLEGLSIHVPPLRERRDEIEPLAREFLKRASAEWGAKPSGLSPEALSALANHRWPGNVRQLRHAVERAALLCSGSVIQVEDLPPQMVGTTRSEPRFAAPPALVEPESAQELGLKERLVAFERLVIQDALTRAGGNRRGASKLLRVPLRTLFRRMRAAGLSRDLEGEA